MIYHKGSQRPIGRRLVDYVNYSLVSIVLCGILFVAERILDAFLSGRVDQILRGAR